MSKMGSPTDSFYSYYEDKEDSIQNTETQTSRTILQLAADELASLENLSRRTSARSRSSECKTPKIIRSRRSSARSCDSVRKNSTVKKKSPSVRNRTNLSIPPRVNEGAVGDGKKPKVANFDEFDINDVMNKLISKDSARIPQLSRFAVTRIHIKIVPKPYNDGNDSPSSFEDTNFLPPEEIESDTDSISVENQVCHEVPEILDSPEPEYAYESDSQEIVNLVATLKNPVWSTSLEALQNLTNLSHLRPPDLFLPYMPEINQAVIQLIQSPRSAVCRTCCQIAGELFKTVADIRRPEFDDIVNILLGKTADVNRFIKTDANAALDAMVSNIPPFHAVRAICSKGTKHKNDLVRVTSSRLLVQIVSVCGNNLILGHGGNEFTRKRILMNMINFRSDKNVQVRQNGEKLYKKLHLHPNFEGFMKNLTDSKLSVRRRVEL